MKFLDETASPPKDSISGVFHFISSWRESDLIGANEESFANVKATSSPLSPLHLSPLPCFIVGKLEELDDSLPSKLNGPL